MNLTQYAKTLYAILWNIIVFLCPIFSQNNTTEKKTSAFSCFVRIDNHLNIIYQSIKELINKITSKQNNNSTASTMAVSNNTNKNTKSMLNRLNSNTTLINQALKSAYLLYSKRLKDAQATQILISKHYFSCPEDKCAFLYPLYHCSLYIF